VADHAVHRQESDVSLRAGESGRWPSPSGKGHPYDVPGVELGHVGDRCSFDAFLGKHKLEDPALQALAVIVRGADTDARQLTPESAGLYALATGFQAIAKDDHDNMSRQFHAYDARTRTPGRTWPALGTARASERPDPWR
jgi:hypothetical protein